MKEAAPGTAPPKGDGAEAPPLIHVGAWLRAGGTLQGTSDPSRLDDWRMSSIFPILQASGHVHEKVGLTLDIGGDIIPLVGPSMGPSANNVTVMDAIISFDFLDELHLWAGRLLVPVDRANWSGPFFMIPWNYPGLLTVGPTLLVATPREGLYGRNNGAVIWGNLFKDRLTYLAGAFDTGNGAESPLYSGRLGLALWDREPGFWGSGSAFGEKDLLSLGVGGQYQKNGSGPNTAWGDFNADVVVEKRLPARSFITAEGAYYHFNVADGAVNNTFYVLAAYATPVIGIGNIQPMVRYLWAGEKNVPGTQPWNLDAALAYLVKGPALRATLTYSHTRLPGDVTGNALQLGAQALFF